MLKLHIIIYFKMVVMNTMEWLILGAICLLVFICIFLIVFFCRRNRNEHIVISAEPMSENEAEAPVVDVNKNKFKFYDDMMNRLDSLNKKADIAIENDKKTLENMKNLNIKLEEDKEKLEDIVDKPKENV